MERKGEVVLDAGRIVSLKHFKEDVKKVRKGSECGVIIADYGDFQEGDRLSFYEVVPRKLGLYDEDPTKGD